MLLRDNGLVPAGVLALYSKWHMKTINSSENLVCKTYSLVSLEG